MANVKTANRLKHSQPAEIILVDQGDTMNHLKNECSRCGVKLPVGTGDESCQKCLLEMGLESGTDVSLGNLAETLPHRGEPSRETHTDRSDNPSGFGAIS